MTRPAPVRLLLDEMFSPAVAAELRELGHDVIAIAERPELRSKSDDEVFAWACAEKRWVLTENVKDFRPILLRALQGGMPPCGLLFTSSRTFHRSRKNPGPLIRSVHAWLTAEPPAPSVAESWLVEPMTHTDTTTPVLGERLPGQAPRSL